MRDDGGSHGFERHLGVMILLPVMALISSCSASSNPDGADAVAGNEVGNISTETTRDQLADYAKELGIEAPPEVSVVREIHPDEHIVVLTECMEASGFPPSTSESAVVAEWQIQEEQTEAFNLAQYTCRAQYPVAEKYTQPLTSEQLGVVYDHWINDTIPCLESLGYTIEEPPPSRSAYQAGALWDPRQTTFEQVIADVKSGQWSNEEEVFTQKCPTDPPEDVLYGD